MIVSKNSDCPVKPGQIIEMIDRCFLVESVRIKADGSALVYAECLEVADGEDKWWSFPIPSFVGLQAFADNVKRVLN